MKAFTLAVSVSLALAASVGHARERLPGPVISPYVAPADVCLLSTSTAVESVPGNLRWTITLTNTRSSACTLTAFDFPAVSLGLDGKPWHGGSNGIVTPVGFQPEMDAVSLTGGGSACALVELEADDGASLGEAVHCDGLAIAGNASVQLEVWTAALKAPPYRYCLTGFADVATATAPRTPAMELGGCTDVYRDATTPTGLVLEGPIDMGVNGTGRTQFQWIGGNYSTDALQDVSVTVQPPAGENLQLGTRPWMCRADFGASTWTCSLRTAARGPLPALVGSFGPLASDAPAAE